MVVNIPDISRRWQPSLLVGEGTGRRRGRSAPTELRLRELQSLEPSAPNPWLWRFTPAGDWLYQARIIFLDVPHATADGPVSHFLRWVGHEHRFELLHVCGLLSEPLLPTLRT